MSASSGPDRLAGSAWRLGDHVNTDAIIPTRYLNTTEAAELGPHCFEGLDPTLAEKIAPGDIVVAGDNFGYGSSREHAPLAMLGLGISCVIACSFGEIFYRNAFNRGLPLLETDAVEGIETGDRLRVDLVTGELENERSGQRFASTPIPPFMRDIVNAGGLIPYVLAESSAG